MNLTLTKVKYLKSLSEETPAYTATVLLDGKPFCHVSNHGHGGCDEQHMIAPFTNADLLKAIEFLKPTYGDFEPFDSFCQEKLFESLNAGIIAKQQEQLAKFKSEFSSKLIFLKTPKGRGIVSIPYDDTNKARVRLYVKQKWPKAVILNDASEEKLTQLLCG
ncbi:MAG: hypothetical protein ACXWWG_00530 [Nitrospira sp.]